MPFKRKVPEVPVVEYVVFTASWHKEIFPVGLAAFPGFTEIVTSEIFTEPVIPGFVDITLNLYNVPFKAAIGIFELNVPRKKRNIFVNSN